jgi:hypothetical protein
MPHYFAAGLTADVLAAGFTALVGFAVFAFFTCFFVFLVVVFVLAAFELSAGGLA